MPKKQKKIAFLLSCVLGTFLLSFIALIPAVFAECALSEGGFIPIPSVDCFADIPSPPNPDASGTEILKLLVGGLYKNAKYIISALAIAFIVFAGFRMVTARGEETPIGEQKTHLLWTLIGIMLLAISWEIMDIFKFANEDGTTFKNFLNDSNEIIVRVRLFDEQAKNLLIFGRYIIGSLTVLYIVRSGTRMVVSGGDEQVQTQEKKNFIGYILALIIVMVADFLINKVLYIVNKTSMALSSQGVEPAINTQKGVELLAQLTRFVASFAGPLAILMLVISAIYYVTAFGEEENVNKAKTLLKGSIFGIIAIYGAYAIVATFIAGNIEASV